MKTLVIGIGNEYRGDDAVGLVAVRRLRKRSGLACDIVESTGDGAQLMESWKTYDAVIVIDAVQGGGDPGYVYRIDVSCDEVPTDWYMASTHLFSLSQAVRLSCHLGTAPEVMILYGIEANLLDIGEKLSPKVSDGLEQLLPMIEAELEDLMRVAPNAS